MTINRIFCLVIVLLSTMVAVGQRATAEPDPLPNQYTISTPTMYAIAGEPTASPTFIPPTHLDRAAATAQIDVTYIGDWPPEAQAAFEYAAGIWESFLISSVPIVVEAQFSDELPFFALGAGTPATIHANFPAAAYRDTWYPSALADSISLQDLAPGDPDIVVVFNSGDWWYLGIDGNTPNNQYDFVTVALKLLGKGFGFAGTMTLTEGQASWGFNLGNVPLPWVYDQFTENGAGQSLIDESLFPNGSAALAAQLTSNNIYFDGRFTRAANNGQPAKLYAPSTWFEGVSYDHLDELFSNTADDLMTHSTGRGEAIHAIGPVTRAIYYDLGWPTIPPPEEPQMALPSLILVEGSQPVDNLVDLWAHTYDFQSANDQLIFLFFSQTDTNLGGTIDNNRYIDINPTAGWLGESTITIRVIDQQNNQADDTVTIKAVEIVYNSHLPLVRTVR